MTNPCNDCFWRHPETCRACKIRQEIESYQRATETLRNATMYWNNQVPYRKGDK